MNFVADNSAFYAKYVQRKPEWRIEDLRDLPVVTKNSLVQQASEIATISADSANVSYTGGTTGASLKVLYDPKDTQDRFAALDNFRSQHGYELGKRTAWFSGKELLSKRNLKSKKFYKDDRKHNVRYFSTFHFNKDVANHYWDALTQFSPEYLVGFPFSVYDICRYAELKGWSAKLENAVFFPTAETVTQEHRRCIGKVLGCKVLDQYASSEGAPLIFECNKGRHHIHPLTGVFEVVDSELNPATSGQILVTSFTTTGTPLVRYQIGDSITLSADDRCQCGSPFPLVDCIEGREGNYLFSKETGRISGSNLGNSTKYVEGILCFQGVQLSKSSVAINVVANDKFDGSQLEKFENALRERLGNSIEITINRLDHIPRAKSGKFRFIINDVC